MTAASPFVLLPAPLDTASLTPQSGMDVDQHDAGLDESATPFATDQDIQLAADDSPPLAACQGAAAAQQAASTQRKKPANWAFMTKKKRKRWFETVKQHDGR